MVSTLYLQFDMECGMCLYLSLKKDRHFITGPEKTLQRLELKSLQSHLVSK